MKAWDAQRLRRLVRAASAWPGQLALLALTGLMGLLVGTAYSPSWGATDGTNATPESAPRPVAPVRPQREGAGGGLPEAITETVQVDGGGYLVLRFEPTYRFVAVIGSSDESVAADSTPGP